MLLPKELDKLPDRVVALYAELENDIIRDMARRIVKTDFATDTAQWQLIQLQRMSVTHDEVFDRLSKATGKSKKELVEMFNEAANTAFSREDKAYRRAGYKTVPLAENVQLQKIINSGLRKTEYLFENLTSTTANTATRQFENALDRAYMQITSGAFDYSTAIRTCIRDLAQKGIAYITYPSGHTDYLDVAVRRAALTGVGQTCGEMQLELAAEMDCDLVEVTAHNGARPEHAVWQGKVFSLSGKHPKYPDFKKSTGYGTGAGLKGWNCRHDFFPFFEDSKPAYTQAELAEFENRKVTYNGETMTEYDAAQKQRAMERRIRATKRELAGYDAGIAAAADENLKAELQTAFDRKSVLLKRQEAALRDFTKQTGLARDRAREQVYGFNKSVSQKAVFAEKVSVGNQRRASEIIQVLPKEKGDTFKPENLVKGLKKSDVGKETLEYIISENIDVQVNYNPEITRNGLLGLSHGKHVDIFGLNTKTKNETVKTIIHEITHVKYDIGECQWAEAVCETRALQHEKGILTIQDKRNIIKEIKKNYPDMKWRNRRD